MGVCYEEVGLCQIYEVIASILIERSGFQKEVIIIDLFYKSKGEFR